MVKAAITNGLILNYW